MKLAKHFNFVVSCLCAFVLSGHGVATAQSPAADSPPVLSSLARVRDSGVITIAYRPDAVPFSYLDETKQPIGYGIDICREIVRSLERDLKKPLRMVFVEVSAKTRFDVVNSGKADMECGTTINDPQRRKTADYSMPYQFSGPRFLVRADSKVRGVEDLSGRRISVVPGTNSVPLLQQKIDSGVLRGARMVEYKTYDEAREAVERGEVDAFATIDVLLAAQRAKSKDPAKLAIVGAYLVLEPIAIVLRKGDVEFKKAVDRHLTALMLDGVVARFYTKWFLQPIPPNNLRLDLPMTFSLRDQLAWPTDRLGDEMRR
ncbi:MAG: amino acid ABC transporter substrate-binding protein [Burkholderiaceae bacterium]